MPIQNQLITQFTFMVLICILITFVGVSPTFMVFLRYGMRPIKVN